MMQSAVEVRKNVLSTCVCLCFFRFMKRTRVFLCVYTNHNVFDAKFHELIFTIYVFSTPPAFIDSFGMFAGLF